MSDYNRTTRECSVYLFVQFAWFACMVQFDAGDVSCPLDLLIQLLSAVHAPLFLSKAYNCILGSLIKFFYDLK